MERAAAAMNSAVGALQASAAGAMESVAGAMESAAGAMQTSVAGVMECSGCYADECSRCHEECGWCVAGECSKCHGVEHLLVSAISRTKGGPPCATPGEILYSQEFEFRRNSALRCPPITPP